MHARDLTHTPRQSAILGIHSGALGDVVLFGQLLAGLRAGRGGPVRLVAGGQKAALLAGLGVVDQALDFNALPMAEVFGTSAARVCSLPERLGGCDLLVSCFAAGDAEAERRMAELCSAGEAIFLPIRPPGDFSGHLLDFWARRVGVDLPPPPRWQAPEAWRTKARQALVEAGADPARPYVLIHPGAGSRRKCWPLDRFVALARQLASRRPSRACVFVVGPVELDWWGAQRIAELRAEFPSVASPALTALAGLAAGARAYLGNDSGSTHLAAAVGAPTVAVFGSSDARHFRPRGRRVRVIAGGALEAVAVESALAELQKV